MVVILRVKLQEKPEALQLYSYPYSMEPHVSSCKVRPTALLAVLVYITGMKPPEPRVILAPHHAQALAPPSAPIQHENGL